MSDVPPEIICDIFTRLPVKSLLRFRCLSKPFCALIDSPDFIKSHLNQSLKSNSNRSILAAAFRDLCSIDFDLLDKTVLLEFPLYFMTDIVGCCNGLVCVTGKNESSAYFCIANPSTRNCTELPSILFETPDEFMLMGGVSCGFGYDQVADDYKLVLLNEYTNAYDIFLVNEVKVYSLKSNTWRRTNALPYMLYSENNAAHVNGALHWLVMVKPKPEDSHGLWSRQIVSFDISTEEYCLIPLPQHTPCKGSHISSKYLTLSSDDADTENYDMIWELGGRLCFQRRCNDYIDIWVMNCYGKVDSWTKICSVAQPYDYSSKYLKAVAYSKDGEKLLLEQEGEKLAWYNLKLATVDNTRNPPRCIRLYESSPYISTDSLFKHTAGHSENKTSIMVQEQM